MHVLVAGMAIYMLYLLIDQDERELDEIHVDRAALVEFIANRSRTLDASAAEAHLNALGEPQLSDLIDQFIRENALHREALRLGLDRNDYVMQRRLVQRLESTLVVLATNRAPADEQTLRAYFNENRENYLLPARITFTHVFVDPSSEGTKGAVARAEALLRQLRAQRVRFSQAIGFGDAFLYHRNYVERLREDIASQFGNPMAEALFSMPASDLAIGQWIGPIGSHHGQHLVLVRERRDTRQATFSEVRSLVARDHEHELKSAALESAAQGIVKKYSVTIDLET